jgi:hypothetical protein
MPSRIAVLLCASAMPIVAWFSQRGFFGPDNGTISNQYPTLIVAAGYAFAIWGLIFLLDVLFGIWQTLPANADDPMLQRIRPAAAAGFGLTAAWMIIFPMQLFWLALAVIWLDLACLLYCADVLSRNKRASPGGARWPALVPLSLHAGWLSLAAFLNLAQVIVAYQLLPVDDMLPWSLVLLAVAGILLLVYNRRMSGNLAFSGAAVWGLAAVYVKQSSHGLAGAPTAAAVAAAIAVLLAVQTIWLVARRR